MTLLAALLAGLAGLVLCGPSVPRSLPLAAAPVLSAAAGALVSPQTAVVAALLTLAVGHAVQRRTTSRAESAERAGAVEAVAVLTSELRAGRAPAEALTLAARVAEGAFGEALAGAGRSLRLGADPCAVLRSADSPAGEALHGLAACLQVCGGSGGSLARATATVAEALRASEEQRSAVETELAGPRATAVMLAGLPVVGTVLAAGLGARPLHVLLHTLPGGACLVVGVLLDLAGLWWTERLLSRAVR